jgi:hypothetical protein
MFVYLRVFIREIDDSYKSFIVKVPLSDNIASLVLKHGRRILYATSNEIEITHCDIDELEITDCYIEDPNDHRVIAYNYDSIDDNDHGVEIDYSDEFISMMNESALSFININTINPEHFDCVGRKICGCGCDSVHDGNGDDYCNPYPKNAIRFD